MLQVNNLKRSRFCWSLSIVKLEQSMFIWKGRHLVLALFVEYISVDVNLSTVKALEPLITCTA